MADEIIDGYKLQNLMVTGQTTQVWEVVEVTSHRHFAMKIMLPEKVSNADLRKLMFHEANVGKQLAHPNVIRIHAISQNPKNPYYVMEFFPAGSLKIRLIRKQHGFIKERAHSIFRQAATGLAYINASGWVHRDVKPDNMLVNSAGELRLIDFALAQRIETASFFSKIFRRKKRLVQGTRSYMSPEQIRGEPLDGRADIYSFGASLYELTTHRPPFRGMSNQELLQKHIIEKPSSPQIYNAELTDEFSKLVLQMLAKKREERPQTFHEVLKGLNTVKIYKNEPAKKE
jgi:serine/threonine protein kinase